MRLDRVNLRILEPADPPELLALNASRIIRITFDFLLPTSHASDRKSLARLASLGDSPMRVDCFAIDDGLTVAAVIVEITQAFALDFSGFDESRQKVAARPNLGAQAVL